MARQMPNEREAMRKKNVPVDYEGMDPSMASTMKGETTRVTKAKAMYAPKSMSSVKSGGSSTAPKKKKWGLF